MARRYAEIWARLKEKKEVKIKCRPAKVATIVLAVRKEKARENAPRKALDLPSFGRLSITADEVKGFIIFKLLSEERAENL